MGRRWFVEVVAIVLWMLAAASIARSMTTASSSKTTTATTAAVTLRNSSGPIVFHWFRLGDLRLDDNPALVHSSQRVAAATAKATAADNSGNAFVVPIFCFDRQIFGSAVSIRTPSQSWKCGPRRAQFILESVVDLRTQLQTGRCHSQLLVAHGDPATVFDNLLTHIFQLLWL